MADIGTQAVIGFGLDVRRGILKFGIGVLGFKAFGFWGLGS